MPPLFLGRMAGWTLGLVLSIAIVGWQHWASYHSRQYVAVARAMAAHDARLGVAQLNQFEVGFAADRLLESDRMRPELSFLRMCGATALKDRELLQQAAADTLSHHDRWVASEQGASRWYRSPSGFPYPLTVSSGFSLRAALVAEDWEEAVRFADDRLGKVDAFWRDLDDISADDELVTRNGERRSVRFLKNHERSWRACLVYALVQNGDDARALAEIETEVQSIMEEGRADGQHWCVLLLVRSAIEHRLGQEDHAQQTYSEATRMYNNYLASVNGMQHGSALPPTLEATWAQFRVERFGLPLLWANGDRRSPHWVWSWRDEPRDFIDAFLDGQSESQP